MQLDHAPYQVRTPQTTYLEPYVKNWAEMINVVGVIGRCAAQVEADGM